MTPKKKFLPELIQDLQCRIYLPLPAGLDHGLYLDRVRAVHDTEHIVTTDKTKARPSTLQVIDSLTHITLGTEDQGCNSVLGVLDFFSLADLHDPLDDLGVCQAGVAEDCTTRLEWFDDFVRLVAGEGETSGCRVDFHCTAQGLLSTGCHAKDIGVSEVGTTEGDLSQVLPIGFIQNDQLVPAWGQCHLFLCETLDAVANHVDT